MSLLPLGVRWMLFLCFSGHGHHNVKSTFLVVVHSLGSGVNGGLPGFGRVAVEEAAQVVVPPRGLRTAPRDGGPLRERIGGPAGQHLSQQPVTAPLGRRVNRCGALYHPGTAGLRALLGCARGQTRISQSARRKRAVFGYRPVRVATYWTGTSSPA